MSLKDNKKQIVKKISDSATVVEITKKVYYHNTIARMNNKFSLEEEKALHIIFSHIKPFNYENATTVKIEKKKFFKYLGLVGKDRWERYRILTSSLINKTFTELIDEKGGRLIGILVSASYWQPKKTFFEIKLNDWFMPFLEKLKEHYTKVDLKTVCAFKSKHALTLYKFICSWNNDNDKINHKYQTTKELKEIFGLTINDYVYNGKFVRSLFEKYTIDVAISEINQHSDLTVSYHKIKNGNKVESYEFKWTKNTMSQEQIQKVLEESDNS